MFNLNFTKMKKLFYLLSFVAFIGLSGNVFGQNSGTAIRPSVGDVFTYSVLAGSDTYVWTLEDAATGGGTNLFTAAVVASATGASTKDVTITWVNPTVDFVYYLHLVATKNGCTNRKVLAIQPKNNFTLQIVNVDATGSTLAGPLETDNPVCAPAIPNTIAWNGTAPVVDGNKTDFNYDYGTSTFYYKITAAGINFANTTWTPSITIAKVGGTNSTQTIETKLGGLIGAGTWGVGGPTLTVGPNTPTIAADAANTVIWVKVTVSNLVGTPANANQNIVDNDFVFTLETASKDQHNNQATSLGNGSTTQTQSARPDTGVITHN